MSTTTRCLLHTGCVFTSYPFHADLDILSDDPPHPFTLPGCSVY
jgi:hypothetical protein